MPIRSTASNCLVALYLSLPFAYGVAQQSAMPFHARLLSTQELVATRARLDSTLVPRVAEPLELDPKQVFVVERGSRPAFYVMPVRYESFDTEVPNHTSYRCGVFILPTDGKEKFYPTIGYGDSEPVQCTETKAVSFLNLGRADVPPTIYLIYKGYTPNAETGGIAIFSWNSTKKAFFEDDALENSLIYDPRSVSAKAVERQLRKKGLR